MCPYVPDVSPLGVMWYFSGSARMAASATARAFAERRAAAKAALDGFVDVLRQELYGTGVRVTSIFPGRVDTPMIQHLTVPWVSPKISPDRVVKSIITGIRTKRSSIIVPALYGPVPILNFLFPRLMDWGYRIFGIEGIPKKVEGS